MAYTKQTWANGPAGNTPLSAARLQFVEDGLASAALVADNASATAGSAVQPAGLTKSAVGLGSVDNTADTTKAVLSATKLATPRTINGVSFDGTANVTIPAIGRSIVPISTATTLAAVANTDYVYKLTAAAAVPTLPTAVGNTNRYSIKNAWTAPIILGTTSSQTIDGSTNYTLPPGSAISLMSDNANWMVVD